MWMGTVPTTEYGRKPERKELEQILRGIANGEKEALAQLYRNTRTAVYATALSVLKNADRAQDVTQDTFVRIWENAAQYRAQGSPMAWILTITRNLALTELRRDGRQAELDEEAWDAIPSGGQGLGEEDRYLLQTALSILTDEERRIVISHAVAGLKHREIAELLELPLATVLSKYHRALKKLRIFMKGEGAL